MKTGGTIYYSSLLSYPSTYTLKNKVWTTNPSTGQPWTVSDINGLEIGIEITGYTDEEGICTQVYVEIEYGTPFIPPPKSRVEIFREPGFFDDHFQKGWTKITGGWEFNGDTMLFYSTTRAEKDLPSLQTSTYTKIIIRVTSVEETGTWNVQVWDSISGTWKDIWLNQTGVGVFETVLTSGWTLTKIALIQPQAGISNKVTFDYVAICKNSLLVPDEGDLVNTLKITLPVVDIGVNGAELTIPNFGGTYNGLIKGQDVIIIWLARDETNLGTTPYKAFGGRIVNLTNLGKRQGEFYINLECHGHAYELNIPPSLLQRYYSAINGRTIIEEALALCSYLSKHPTASKWFDNTGASGNTNDQISSSHDVDYEEKPPLTVIQEILRKAKNPAAVQGFDIYEEASGVLIGHLQNSLDFISPGYNILPFNYQYSQDIHRLRNKIKVYGKFGGKIPPDGDWAETLDNWTLDQGTLMELSTSYVKTGTKSIHVTGSTSQTVILRRTVTPYDHISGKKHTTPLSGDSLRQWFWPAVQIQLGSQIELWAPDSSNKFIYTFAQSLGAGQWHYPIFTFDDTSWTTVGSPKWENIKQIRYLLAPPSGQAINCYIDTVHINDARFSGSAEDAASQATFSVRSSEPQIDDVLETNLECEARAQSILATIKQPIKTVSNVMVDGDNSYRPGDIVRVSIPNDNLDENFRILQIEHSANYAEWNMVLTLSQEPQMIDLVFRLIEQRTKLLERRI